MFLSFALLAVLAPSPSSAVQDDPAVRITLNEAGRYERGDYARVKVRVEDDGYLVVLHADPDGRVRVLYPIDPDDDTWVRGRRSYELRDRGGDDRLFMVEGRAAAAWCWRLSPVTHSGLGSTASIVTGTTTRSMCATPAATKRQC